MISGSSVLVPTTTTRSGSLRAAFGGSTEMMSMPRNRGGDGPPMMDSGNLRLRAKHPQSQQGVCADAIAGMQGITRADVDALALDSQRTAAAALAG